MLDKHTEENGYTEYSVPFVKSDSLFGTGQLPKFDEVITVGMDHWLYQLLKFL